jgi:hypothetical protein
VARTELAPGARRLDASRQEVGMTQSGDALARLLVSAIIVVILATQAVAGLVNTGRWGWPMIAYPMYSEAHYEGDRLNHDLVGYAVLADSSRVEIRKSDLNMDFWLYWYNVVHPIRNGRLDLLQPVLRRYCAQSGNQVTRLVVKDLGMAIGRDGPVHGLPPQIIYQIAVACP